MEQKSINIRWAIQAEQAEVKVFVLKSKELGRMRVNLSQAAPAPLHGDGHAKEDHPQLYLMLRETETRRL